MQAVAKTHYISIQFKPRTPARIINSIKKQYATYIKDDTWIDDPITEADDRETVDPFSTAWYRNVAKNTTAGDRLNTERFKASMTQVRLSELTGIPQHHLSEMEHGKRYIGRETARKLAKVFKTDYRYFL